ncbi:BlaI/MecI/CopY family transcriptional regulator [Pelotomaculum terephthalicicum JT]|nr:BlaI/MecI/CopY family transcriptional regulator [Pelotomaculum terephthalicicum JT]
MKILWERGTATSTQIIDVLLKTTDWKPKTIQTLITRLVSKAAVAADKTNPKMFLYRAEVSREQYMAAENQSFLRRVYDNSMKMMLATFVREQKLTDEDFADLQALLKSEKKI